MNSKSNFKKSYSAERAANASYGLNYVRNGGSVTLSKYLPEIDRCGDYAINQAAFLCASTPLDNEVLPGIYHRISQMRNLLKTSEVSWVIGFAGIKSEIAAAKAAIREKRIICVQ